MLIFTWFERDIFAIGNWNSDINRSFNFVYRMGVRRGGGDPEHIIFTKNKTVTSRTFLFIMFHYILCDGYKNTIHGNKLQFSLHG